MTGPGRTVLVALLLSVSLGLVVAGPPRAAALGPPVAPAPCAIAVERAGEGVACLSAGEAARLGVVAGDRIAADGAVGRMAPERVELFAAPIDLNAASIEELAVLPGIGPALAQRIAERRPYHALAGLRSVPGIGELRLRAIAPRLHLATPESR